MSKNYRADNTALLKILLHSAKYATSSVNGLLLGKISGAAEGAVESSDGSTRPGQRCDVSVFDVIPVGHSYLSLAPLLDSSLIQIDAYAKENGLQIVGYYHANERLTDVDLGQVARKIADKIQQRTPEACVLLVDNKLMHDFLRESNPHFLQLYVKDGARSWTKGSNNGLALETRAGGLPKIYLDLIGDGRHHALIDFEDHMNDIALDWRNIDLDKK
eukprot:jgi/Botrbrau1/8690/Bobra.0311s0005.1